ncbi:hypothetical protein BJY04DRAFT_221416 [Aspergillus karnatakaensis]|uniref:uncharacterized protein n=1 Tax=Aspergillus karnatakaensis TaxID=1810916 RepID=UPI003CCD63A2
MRFTFPTLLALTAFGSASPTSVLATRDAVDPIAACQSRDAQEGDCRLVITTGLGVTLSGDPAPGTTLPAVGWYSQDRGAYLFDHNCELLEESTWSNQAAGDRGWDVEFIENDKHDYLHAFAWVLGTDSIPEPDMSSGKSNPLDRICGAVNSHTEGLVAGWFRVCTFTCTGGLQTGQ